MNTFSGDNLFGPCQADKQGVFGWDNEEEISLLEFTYELETRPGVLAEKGLGLDMLIFTLQRSMMENVLPALFPDQCQGSNGHGLNRERVRRLRNLMAVGVSAFPQDKIDPNRKCCYGDHPDHP